MKQAFPSSNFLNRTITVFTSPKSGSGKGRQEIDRLKEHLRLVGAEVRFTSEIAVLDQMRDDADGWVSDPPQAVVVVGGDGTLSLVTSRLGFIGGDNHTITRYAILPMPMGTENLLARHFGYQFSAAEVMKTLQHGTLQAVDCGMVNDKPFLTMATFGFDAEVVRAMHLGRRGHIRKHHYLSPIVRAMWNYSFPPVRLSLDVDDVVDCYQAFANGEAMDGRIDLSGAWVMCFNLPCYGGGLKIEPAAIGDDGLLDVIVFKRGSVLGGLHYLHRIKRGTHLEDTDVIRFRTQRFSIAVDAPVPWQHDGDYGGQVSADQKDPTEVTIRSKVISLVVPPSAGNAFGK